MEYYLARDKDNSLRLYQEGLFRSNYFDGMWIGFYIKVDDNSFPEITWENSPVKVKINIEKEDEQVNEIIQEEAENNVVEPDKDVHQEER